MRTATCQCCGQKTVLPDPPAKTIDERFAFERAWDARFRASQEKKA